ncbi:hypothetical protein K469DRAFT_707746 [Zopfia rhizophila CBS 207.26]|uniref:Uncharacterized protein n=1 Tax=Zopfia rhizophila CBS 207.26 TaxID=1314779 RepID=A0A6A6E4R5_9PEZI|nr:hypothetical protein K469DRAFT_707746 [Zopfia rhizophila CBS 207.26]
MPKTKEEAGPHSTTERAELSEEERAYEINNTYSLSGAADGVGGQALSANKENTVGETRAEKKLRLLRELEDLTEEEEAVKKKEEEELRKAEEELKIKVQEVNELECQLKNARKRVQEHQAQVARKRARVESLGQDERPTYLPPTENTPTSSGIDDTTASISQTAVAFSLGPNDHAIPGNSINSASSPKPHASSSYRPIGGTMSTSSIEKPTALTYYTELSAQGSGKARSFNDMNLDQLRNLAAREKDVDGDVQQTNSAGHIHYFIFLKTGELEHLERAILRAEAQIPVNDNNPDYAPRLKDLIVMLYKKYEHTNSLDSLQEAIFRAQEMLAATPPDHPDRPARMGDWINIMFKKCNCTGLQDDLDEAIMAAREAGAVISVDNPDRGGLLQVRIPMYA